MTADQEAAAEAEKADGKGKKKDDKKDKKEKGKKCKKKKDDDKGIRKVGPTEVVLKFDEFYKQYDADWANRDETKNYD